MPVVPLGDPGKKGTLTADGGGPLEETGSLLVGMR